MVGIRLSGMVACRQLRTCSRSYSILPSETSIEARTGTGTLSNSEISATLEKKFWEVIAFDGTHA